MRVSYVTFAIAFAWSRSMWNTWHFSPYLHEFFKSVICFLTFHLACSLPGQVSVDLEISFLFFLSPLVIIHWILFVYFTSLSVLILFVLITSLEESSFLLLPFLGIFPGFKISFISHKLRTPGYHRDFLRPPTVLMMPFTRKGM